MLTALKLGNFKAFADTQRIPIKPLTLIFGPNSSGKSSILHGLLLARHAMETGELDVHRTSIGGQAVDLGGFRQYVHRGNTQNTVEWAVELDTSKLTGRPAELLQPAKTITISTQIGMAHEPRSLLYGEHDDKWILRTEGDDEFDEMIPVNDPYVRRFELFADGKLLLRMSRRDPFSKEPEEQINTSPRDHREAFDLALEISNREMLQMDVVETEHPVVEFLMRAVLEATTLTQWSEAAGADIKQAINELVPRLAGAVKGLFPDAVTVTEIEERKSESKPQPSVMASLFPVSKGTQQRDLAEAVRFYLPRLLSDLLGGLHATVTTELKRARYLGPLRSFPPRHFAFSEHDDPNWFAGGGHAWDVVRRNAEVREKVNQWLSDKKRLSTPYELTIRHLVTAGDLEGTVRDIIENVENAIVENNPTEQDIFGEAYGAIGGLVERAQQAARVNELVLVDQRSNTVVSHRDVGIGISQVLPVLVAAYGTKDCLHTIEQPEIHLHPALQAELGDVFIESALGESKNTFILETHSEHLILRILRRIRESTRNKNEKVPSIRPDDVALLYVDASQPGSAVKELRVDDKGRLIDRCPGGFFEEDFAELF